MAYDPKMVADCMEYVGLERKILARLSNDPNLPLFFAPADLERDYDSFQRLHDVIYGSRIPFSRTPVAQKYCTTFPPKTSS